MFLLIEFSCKKEDEYTGFFDIKGKIRFDNGEAANYFRVFVMNSYGRMSGSNILKVTASLWDHTGEFTNITIWNLIKLLPHREI